MEIEDMSDVCVGTSVGTITEPECLGPCEPGTSVTLEGIVWHETEGGVLVVNVTWRGKTYVGTLLDCTRHDWAPPRFCDSPTSDLDARTPKGRGKRGRAAANATPGNDLSNFTETRSSVHSKLRNGGKGRRGAQGSPAASPSPAAFVPPRPDPAAKRKSRGPEEEEKSKRRAPPQTPPSGSPPASPVLYECPEPNCSKKYKNQNGLKYHQNHAHGSADDEDTKEGVTSMSENDESNIEAPSPATPVKSPVDKPESTPVRASSPPAATLPPATPTPPPRVPSPMADPPTPILADKTSIVKPGVLRFGQDDLPAPAAAATTVPPATVVPPSPRQPPVQQVSPANPPPQSPSPHPSPHPSPSPRPVPSPHLPTNIPQPINIPQPPPPSQVVQHQPQNQILQPQNLTGQPMQPGQLMSPQPQLQPQLQPAHQLPPVQHPVQAQLGQPAPAHMVHQPGLPPQQAPPQQQPGLQALNQHPGLQGLTNQLPQPGLQSTPPSGHPVQSHMQYPTVGLHPKMPQFKVKPTAALMPEQDKSKDPRSSKPQGYKKKSRKSPGGSPHPSPLEAPIIDSAREDVQSPAYSDISDDGAPVLEAESADKLKQGQEKDVKAGMQTHVPQHYGMFPYYGQPPYLVPSVQDKPGEQKPSDLTPKQDIKPLNIPQMPLMASLQNSEKEKKELSQPPPQQQSHYYSNYGTYIPPAYSYQPQPVAQPQQPQQQEMVDRMDEQKNKIKQEVQQQQSSIKDKQHENHQILKESIEMKSQMSPYHVYHSSQNQRGPPVPGPVQDDRRYYLYPGEQRRKEEPVKPPQQSKPPPPSPKHQPKQEKPQDLGKSEESKNKQEGVKPTMETQGPPPPPTSQYAYIHHPSYMPPQHYGVPFDPNHSVYRGLSPMLIPGPFSGNPYLLPRFHAPEDLSRPQGGKALDLLQHHASQYYSTHKIHELQERALKSPTPKTSAASGSPSSAGPAPARPPSGPPTSVAGGPGPPPGQGPQQGKQQPNNPQQQGPGDNGNGNLGKDTRSPPPQRHVHTHHHTHVGLGYPLIPGQYSAPYGAAVLASQQAAAVAASVISPFPPK
ncbi:hypothetical protein KQX54_007131 [Cotesia glomerata]|uniref:C2H2-type domain-containing protein n=1 Tax=Cotesia glomerata TaxID=32391 RepID=A0AAV7I0V2_COTGL|nr:hypothetical protein KQX54_007131 [Cotesia glomerata]